MKELLHLSWLFAIATVKKTKEDMYLFSILMDGNHTINSIGMYGM